MPRAPQRDSTGRLARLDQWTLGAKLAMTAVVDEIRMKLVGGGIPVPENLIAISMNLQSICHPRR